MKRSEHKNEFIQAATKHFGAEQVLSRPMLIEFCKNNNLGFPHWFANDQAYRQSWGIYRLPAPETFVVADKPKRKAAQPVLVPVVTVHEQPEFSPASDLIDATKVPAVNKAYCKYDHYFTVRDIIKSGIFFPIMITGPSGNGKTMMVEQACAELGRALYKVSVTKETDEESLLGGFRLVNGNTQWVDGPVVTAMKTGGVLFLDELCYGDEKMACLQPILNGEGVLLKRTGEYVNPTAGFAIVAADNTKGQGDITGRYIGANVMNEAFLERFKMTLEQEYPTLKTEKRILYSVLKSKGMSDMSFADKLVEWARQIRSSNENGVDIDVISTRRLVHIIEAYQILGCKKRALHACIARFEPQVKEAFLQAYGAFDDSSENSEAADAAALVELKAA